MSSAEHGIYGYTYPDELYLNAVTYWMEHRHKWRAKPEWISCTPGVVNALGTAIRAFTEPGDGIIIQPPVYTPFRMSIRQNGRKIIENPLIENGCRYEMDIEGLRRLCAGSKVKMLILCSPHNPVGRVWTREELMALGAVCEEHGVIVVSDEIHSDILLNGSRHHVFASLPGMSGRCVVCTAASKTFNLAGLHCSNILIPDKKLRSRFNKTLETESGFGIPYFARAATIAAYTRSGAWLDELIAYLEGTFEMFESFLTEKLPMLGFAHTEGTYLAWTDLRSLCLSDSDQERLMTEAAKLALDEGYIFGKGGSGFERWNLAAPRSKIMESLLRFEAAVKTVP
jgi:cystathionine beta-lyase